MFSFVFFWPILFEVTRNVYVILVSLFVSHRLIFILLRQEIDNNNLLLGFCEEKHCLIFCCVGGYYCLLHELMLGV